MIDAAGQSNGIGPPRSGACAWAEEILSGHLPSPRRERWQPQRAGLLNIFLFEDERFPFGDGRLLLRGTNGTGKSRVLAFLLPFLLDANLHSTRMEPDRDPTRQLAWNLLMGEHHDRLGYSWIEFGRLDAEKGPQFLTLGCGLRAVEDRGFANVWYFITPRRIDADFALVTPQHVALTRRQLAEALGEQGRVFERAADYRRAVDEHLFHLGDRYDDLIELLLSLRQPQLAKKMDPDALESALRNSLPPLSESLLGTAADAFRSLDADRRQLQACRRAQAEIEEFLGPYRRHVRIGLLRAADEVRKSQHAYEKACRSLRELEQQIKQLAESLQQHETAQAEAQSEVVAAGATVSALQASDAARSTERLTEKSDFVQSAERTSQQLNAACDRAKVHVEHSSQRAAKSAQQAIAARERINHQSAQAATLAAPDALLRNHQEQISSLCVSDNLDEKTVAVAFDTTATETRRWQRNAQHLCLANEAIARQLARLKESQAALNLHEADLQRRREAVANAATALAKARAALWQNIEHWFGEATEWMDGTPVLAEIEPQWSTWADRPEGADPIASFADEAYRRRMATLAAEIASRDQSCQLLEVRKQQVLGELRQIESGEELLPGCSPLRDAGGRAGRRGAAFWRLVDFAPTVPEAEHAGWEAALESSGLLDAWLHPDGRLETVENDTLLVVDGEPLSAERQLARVLVPETSAMPGEISRELLMAILARIGVGQEGGRIWVDHSGRWQNGPLAGHGAKEDAEFIGAAARQRHRQRRLRILTAELAECQREEQRLQNIADAIKTAQARLEYQRQSLPSNEAFRLASTALTAEELRAAEAHHAYLDAAKREQAESQHWAGLIDQRNHDAQDMGLARWSEDPQALIAQLDQYLGALHILQRDFADLSDALQNQAEAQDASAQAADSLRLVEQHWAAAQCDFERQRTELETLTRTLGAEAAEITRQIDSARHQLQSAEARREEHLKQASEARGRLDIQRGSVAALNDEIQRSDERRRTAVRCLQQRAERGLIETAAYELTMPQVPWNLTQGVDAARLLYHADQRQAHDDETWNRSQATIHTLRETLRASLSSFDLTPDPEFLTDGLQIVHVPFRGAVLRIDQTAQALADETAAHERVLSEKERLIFEDFLLGEVGLELHRRMHEAAEQVLRMNREVAGRPMSTGMQMRFRWELADEASSELRAARDVLMRVRETWSSDERAALIAFLQKRIQTEHLGNEVATWRTLLESALDYRRWHVLHIDRRPDQQQPWRLLTRRSYSALSGGEKAVALTVPQCAAASAYYSSADRFAPRLILLDEAFAGVSTDNRSSCLELLVSFDLDVVMTSENERGCYPVVPALAICRLSRAPDLPVVLNDVLLWNGKRQQRVVEPPCANDSRLAAPPAASTSENSSARGNGQLF